MAIDATSDRKFKSKVLHQSVTDYKDAVGVYLSDIENILKMHQRNPEDIALMSSSNLIRFVGFIVDHSRALLPELVSYDRAMNAHHDELLRIDND